MKKAIFAALVLFLAVQAIVVAQPAPRPLYIAEIGGQNRVYKIPGQGTGMLQSYTAFVAAADEADAARQGYNGRFIRWIPQAQYTAEHYKILANGYNERYQYDNAIDNANKAIKLNLDKLDIATASAYTERGIAYMGKGNYRQASADYKKASEMFDVLPYSGVKYAALIRQEILYDELKKKGY